MNTSRIIWVCGVPYYAGGTLKQQKVLVGEQGAEFTVPAHIDVNKIPKELLYRGDPNMRRINVRDHWEPAKILGTLPWDGTQTERRFGWQVTGQGYEREVNVITLQVHRMIVGDTDEMAYSSGMHKIEVLRKLEGFVENTDER
jgi:hypothetical protein